MPFLLQHSEDVNDILTQKNPLFCFEKNTFVHRKHKLMFCDIMFSENSRVLFNVKICKMCHCWILEFEMFQFEHILWSNVELF